MRERTFRWTDPRELSRIAFNQGGIERLRKKKTGEQGAALHVGATMVILETDRMRASPLPNS